MIVHVLTLFPGLFDGFLRESIVRIAQDKGALAVDLIDFRRYAKDRHGTVDDRPFGGGPGMLLKPEPIFEAVETLEAQRGPMHRVLLTPAGDLLTQATAERLAGLPELLLLCGRYEGFDERIRLGISWEEISIGEYVLSGGEVPAMVIIDAIARLQPGVLGDEESALRESFREGLLDFPQFTRPRVFRGMSVPGVLLSGNHAEIEAWRRQEAARRTQERSGAAPEEQQDR
ncbi:MAG: tRNA (guanosine(37)-N1)-methyltransferase TrmD [Planctomycetes bacterium]|nr:tRNA (guanosine(37)-N1)-methyltransferase TrmD [Planctomycetota bacterium]